MKRLVWWQLKYTKGQRNCGSDKYIYVDSSSRSSRVFSFQTQLLDKCNSSVVKAQRTKVDNNIDHIEAEPSAALGACSTTQAKKSPAVTGLKLCVSMRVCAYLCMHASHLTWLFARYSTAQTTVGYWLHSVSL